MYKIFISTLILLLCLACSDEEIETLERDNKVVVTGYLFANQSIDSIRIAYPYYADNNLKSNQPVIGLKILITNGQDSTILKENGNGYYSDNFFLIKEAFTYSISFEHEGKKVSATTYVNPTQKMTISKNEIFLKKVESTGGFPSFNNSQELIDIKWENSKGSYYFVNIKNTTPNPEYVNDFIANRLNSGEVPPTFFETEPAIISSYSINSTRELQTYGYYKIEVFKLNSEYVALYNSTGGSSLSIRDAPSNIDNALGIFTAVTAHTLYLNVRK